MDNKLVVKVLTFAVTVFCIADANSDNEIVEFKSCKQSSDHKPFHNCEWAIDGHYDREECSVKWSCTNKNTKAWWSGTLERKAKISQVLIVGRKTSLTDNKPNNFKVILDGGKVCAEYKSPTAVQFEAFKCVGVSKTVRIQLSGTNYLALCQVIVIGQLVERETTTEYPTVTGVLAAYNFKTGTNNLINSESHPIITNSITFNADGAIFNANADYIAIDSLAGYFGYNKQWTVWFRFKRSIVPIITQMFTVHQCGSPSSETAECYIYSKGEITSVIRDSKEKMYVYEKTTEVVTTSTTTWVDLVISFSGQRFSYFLDGRFVSERMSVYTYPYSRRSGTPSCFRLGKEFVAPYNFVGAIGCFGFAASFVNTTAKAANLFTTYCT